MDERSHYTKSYQIEDAVNSGKTTEKELLQTLIDEFESGDSIAANFVWEQNLNKPGLQNEIVDLVDFTNPDNFDTTRLIIDRLEITFKEYFGEFDWEREYRTKRGNDNNNLPYHDLRLRILEKAQQKNANYLLKTRFEKLCMTQGDYREYEGDTGLVQTSIRPLAPGLDCYGHHHTLRIATPEFLKDFSRSHKKNHTNGYKLFHKMKPLRFEDVFIDTEKVDQKLFDEYILSINSGIREEINKDFGIRLQDFSVPEQLYFLSAIQNKTVETVKPIQDLTRHFKEDGFRVFLSLEEGGLEMEKKILDFADPNKVPEQVAHTIFHSYSEIVQAVNQIETVLYEYFEGVEPEILLQSKRHLLKRGLSILNTYHEKISVCKDEHSCDEVYKEIQEKLSLAKESIFVFAETVRVLVENGQFSFEDFKSAQLVFDHSPLPEKIQSQIFAMNKQNTSQYPPSLQEFATTALQKALETPDENQKIIYVQTKEDIIAVMRVVEREDGSYYGASFNVNPTIQGFRVGTELLKQVIQNLSEDKPFVADCYSENPMLQNYINDFGFQITKTYEDYEGTGAKVYQITRFPEKK